MGSFALAQDRSTGTLNGLPFFTIFTGGAPKAAWKGLMRFTTWHISASLEFFNATHMGTHFEPKCTMGKGKFGLVVDKRPETLEIVRKKGHKFMAEVINYKRTGKLPLFKRVYRKAYFIGQRIIGKL